MSRTRIFASALVIWIAFQLSSSPTAVGRVGAAAPRFKAVAFDYFVLFDPDSIVSKAEEMFPGKGRQLTAQWRNRQFEYTWLRSIAHRYVDFAAVTRDALTYSANALNLELTPDDERRLLDAYLHLTPWPESRNPTDAEAVGRSRDRALELQPADAPRERRARTHRRPRRCVR